MIAFPNCKINLGLNILRKREDGYHDLETVFLPLPLCDVLEIIPAEKESGNLFTLTGLPLDSNNENNLCIKAYGLLKERYPYLPSIQMHLHKAIPAGGGLGGGSADGAFALRVLNTIFNLNLSDSELASLALRLGSDCPFFLFNKCSFSTGRGELLSPVELNLNDYRFVIINPGIHVSTAGMFSRITPAVPAVSLKEKINLPVERWKDEIQNDFESVVFPAYPEIKKIKEKLYEAGAVYASMSGSGSTVYGIFRKEDEIKLDFAAGYFTYTFPK